jgi:hypothetical protein
MNKDIFSFFCLYEPKTFAGIKPFDFTFHVCKKILINKNTKITFFFDKYFLI